MEPSNQLLGLYLCYLAEKNKDERFRGEGRQKEPRKKLQSIIRAALAASGWLFVTIGTCLQRIASHEKQQEVVEESASSYQQEHWEMPPYHTSA